MFMDHIDFDSWLAFLAQAGFMVLHSKPEAIRFTNASDGTTAAVVDVILRENAAKLLVNSGDDPGAALVKRAARNGLEHLIEAARCPENGLKFAHSRVQANIFHQTGFAGQMEVYFSPTGEFGIFPKILVPDCERHPLEQPLALLANQHKVKVSISNELPRGGSAV